MQRPWSWWKPSRTTAVRSTAFADSIREGDSLAGYALGEVRPGSLAGSPALEWDVRVSSEDAEILVREIVVIRDGKAWRLRIADEEGAPSDGVEEADAAGGFVAVRLMGGRRSPSRRPLVLWSDMKVAVLGATGAVGREMTRILEERNFPVDEFVPLASARSVGRLVSFAGEEHEYRRAHAGRGARCRRGLRLDRRHGLPGAPPGDRGCRHALHR